MQWLQRDGSVHVDFYEQWAVPPAQAVEDDLRQWLADAGLFSAVVAPGSRLNADFVLEGELDVFIADLNAGVGRVALAVVLLDQRQGATKVLLQRTETRGGQADEHRTASDRRGDEGGDRRGAAADRGRRRRRCRLIRDHNCGHLRVRLASCSGVSGCGTSPRSRGWSGRLAGSRQQSASPRLRVQ